MLIRFTVKNFGSFLEEQSLSMIKGKGTKLPNHINADETAGFKTLRGAVIYGANASGKSNLIRAMNYARNFIVHNQKKDKIEQFRLDSATLEQPSSFNFEFKIGDQAYSYGFESKGTKVCGEWLYEIFSTKEDKLLFSRGEKLEDKANIEFGTSITNQISDQKERADLLAIARTTPDDALFLYDAKHRNINHFLEPFDWFEKILLILSPESIEPFVTKDGKFMEFLDRILKAADTGIIGVRLNRDEDLSRFLPPSLVERLQKNLESEGDSAFVAAPHHKQRFSIVREKGKLCSYRLVTLHKDREGNEIPFELSDESDGTRRLIDLAPAFLSEQATNRVLVIDEMDRSLHPMITQMLHDLHYNDDARINGQMILATHEHYLLCQEFYRRDEIWFVEKDQFGISKIKSLSEYKIRYDKDVEKDYLLGRYGATPFVRKLYA
jgi:AAA15 family ATPase/GTPase